MVRSYIYHKLLSSIIGAYINTYNKTHPYFIDVVLGAYIGSLSPGFTYIFAIWIYIYHNLTR